MQSPVFHVLLSYHPCDTVCYLITRVIKVCILIYHPCYTVYGKLRDKAGYDSVP